MSQKAADSTGLPCLLTATAVCLCLVVLLWQLRWQALLMQRSRSISLHSAAGAPHDHDNTAAAASAAAAALPAELRGATYNTSLGCWHVRADSRGVQSFHVAAEANFEPGARWKEVLKAIHRTHSSNPGVHYILVTRKLSMLELAQTSLANVPHDIWFCPEILYGTPIHIGNLYHGPKFTLSIDNWIPPLTWQCNFTTTTGPVVYVVQRHETEELSGSNNSCEYYLTMGSADGLFYDNIPSQVVDYLRFPRTYWGCENVALFVLQRAGMKLVNLCPWFAPVHMHKGNDRDPGRLRINHGANNVNAGEKLDITASLCRRQHTVLLPAQKSKQSHDPWRHKWRQQSQTASSTGQAGQRTEWLR